MYYQVTVRYVDSSGTYQFLTDMSDIKKGDKLVVKSSNGYAVVTALTDSGPITSKSKATAFVVYKCGHFSEGERITKYNETAWKMAELEKMREEFLRNQLDALLAKSNPKAAKLMEELDVFCGEV